MAYTFYGNQKYTGDMPAYFGAVHVPLQAHWGPCVMSGDGMAAYSAVGDVFTSGNYITSSNVALTFGNTNSWAVYYNAALGFYLLFKRQGFHGQSISCALATTPFSGGTATLPPTSSTEIYIGGSTANGMNGLLAESGGSYVNPLRVHAAFGDADEGFSFYIAGATRGSSKGSGTNFAPSAMVFFDALESPNPFDSSDAWPWVFGFPTYLGSGPDRDGTMRHQGSLAPQASTRFSFTRQRLTTDPMRAVSIFVPGADGEALVGYGNVDTAHAPGTTHLGYLGFDSPALWQIATRSENDSPPTPCMKGVSRLFRVHTSECETRFGYDVTNDRLIVNGSFSVPWDSTQNVHI